MQRNYIDCHKKVNFVLKQITKAQKGKKVVALLFPWLRRWKAVGGQRHAPPTIPPGKRPGTYCTEGSYGVFDLKCGKLYVDPSLSSVFLAVLNLKFRDISRIKTPEMLNSAVVS
jgi:hypothetical protein